MPEKSEIVVVVPLEVIKAVLFHADQDRTPRAGELTRGGPNPSGAGIRRPSAIGEGASAALQAAVDRGPRQGPMVEVQFSRREEAAFVRDYLFDLAQRVRTTEKTTEIFRDAAREIDAALRAGHE